MKLSKKRREELRAMFDGRCAYCGCVLPEKGWHLDHLEAVNRELKFAKDKRGWTVMIPTGRLYSPENDRMDNLMPSCAPCNIDKSSSTLDAWRLRLQGLSDNLLRNSSTFRHALRFGRVEIVQRPVTFWFERVSAK